MLKNNYFYIKTNNLFSISLNVSFSTYCSSCACLKQGYKKNKLIFYLETINWFSLSKYGFIIVPFTYKSIENKQGVYITIYIGLCRKTFTT
jgi:hypothetical protein